MADFKNKVVYQIYPKSFKDSNGDGMGDLRGVTEKLDYLADMGVDYLWLTPFFVSPQKDNGYDVADYLDIDPHFGTMADFDALVQAADAKGLKIMLDMVLCHTSDQHAWFQRALSGDENTNATISCVTVAIKKARTTRVSRRPTGSALSAAARGSGSRAYANGICICTM